MRLPSGRWMRVDEVRQVLRLPDDELSLEEAFELLEELEAALLELEEAWQH